MGTNVKFGKHMQSPTVRTAKMTFLFRSRGFWKQLAPYSKISNLAEGKTYRWKFGCHRRHTIHGPFTSYGKLLDAHAPGRPGTFSLPPRVNDPDTLGTCMTHGPWFKPGSLTSGFLWSRWWEKRPRHSRCMHNQQLSVSDKRPMGSEKTWLINQFSLSVVFCKCKAIEDNMDYLPMCLYNRRPQGFLWMTSTKHCQNASHGHIKCIYNVVDCRQNITAPCAIRGFLVCIPLSLFVHYIPPTIWWCRYFLYKTAIIPLTFNVGGPK